jgi:hypothetical protein
MKFGGGWFALISKELMKVIPFPENYGHYGLVNGFYTKQTATSVGIAAANIALVDAETSQDIERLCREIEAYEKKFDD